jgi:hypothetical protein
MESDQAVDSRSNALERLVSRPLGAVLVFAAALGVYAFRAVGWPLTAGRDLDEYVYAYVQLLDADPVLPWSLLFRTPVTPVVAGFSLDMVDGALAEVVFALLFACSVLAWSVAARFFGPWVAIGVALALLVYPAYGILFHAVNSEPVFAAAFALWALLLVRAVDRPSTARWAVVGLAIALAALVRPGNAVLLAFALFPLLLPGSARERTARAAALALAAVLPLAAWSVHNGVRYEEWTLARGGNAVIPFYRAFITDRIVSPENGESSRRLAGAVQRDLLTREPYRSYGVTLDEVFSSGSFRIHEDLYLLSDEVFGWDTDYAVLREAGIEAVRAHPATYAKGVAKTVWLQLSESLFRDTGGASVPPPAGGESSGQEASGLPPPSEGQPIPGGQVVWISRPDNAIRQVWRSPTEFDFAFSDPALRPRFEAVERRRAELMTSFPDRKANATLALRLDQLSRWFPRPIIFIVVGLVAIAIRRPRNWPTLVAIGLAAFAVVLLNALGLFADRHFVLPVSPAFVLLGLGGLLGVRATGQRVRARA